MAEDATAHGSLEQLALKMSPRHLRFAHKLAEGASKSDAYRYAVDRETVLPQTAWRCGIRIAERPDVTRYVMAMRDRMEGRSVLSAQERREWLARLARADVLSADLPGDLVNGYTERTDKDGGTTTTLKVPDKLRAIELDARLSGDLDERARQSVTIDLGSLLASLPDERTPFVETGLGDERKPLEDKT